MHVIVLSIVPFNVAIVCTNQLSLCSMAHWTKKIDVNALSGCSVGFFYWYRRQGKGSHSTECNRNFIGIKINKNESK